MSQPQRQALLQLCFARFGLALNAYLEFSCVFSGRDRGFSVVWIESADAKSLLANLACAPGVGFQAPLAQPDFD